MPDFSTSERKKMARLIVDSGKNQGMIYPIKGERCTIGRSATNDVQIIDNRVSRLHAEIYLYKGDYYIKDGDSKNGTHVNSVLITKPFKLSANNSIKIGDSTLIFENEPEPSSLENKPKIKKLKTETTTRAVRIVTEEDWAEVKKFYPAQSDPYLKQVETRHPTEDLIKKPSSNMLSILYQVADSIRSIFNPDDLLRTVMDIVFQTIPCDIGVMLLFEKGKKDLFTKIIKTRDESIKEIEISESIVDKSIKEKLSILVSDAQTDTRFKATESIIAKRIHSALCAPIVFKDEVFGVIYLDSRSGMLSFTQDQLELLTSICNQSALALSNAKMHTQIVEQKAMEREMEIARNIQLNILPKESPKLANYEVSSNNIPAKKVAGDYYDYITLKDEKMGFVIADVSGKGVPAALLISTVKSHLRMQSSMLPGDKITEIMTNTNNAIVDETTESMFIALVYGALDPKTGDFIYVNAGHTYPLLFQKDKEYRSIELREGGCFLGVEKDTGYTPGKVSIKKGDILILYTDGLTDSQNAKAEFYGSVRLKKFIKKNVELSAKEICDLLYKDVQAFIGNNIQFDDITMIVIKAI